MKTCETSAGKASMCCGVVEPVDPGKYTAWLR